MFQIRLHGRGGQGVVTAAELMSIAGFEGGKYAQAFPSFGSERTGAPVVAYCRFDTREIRRREPILDPNAVLIQDPTLLHSLDVFGGLVADGYILINANKTFDELGIADFVAQFPADHVARVDATGLALKHVGRPVPNAALLGGFAAVTEEVTLDAVANAIRQKFSGRIAQGNIAAATAAYEDIAGRHAAA